MFKSKQFGLKRSMLEVCPFPFLSVPFCILPSVSILFQASALVCWPNGLPSWCSQKLNCTWQWFCICGRYKSFHRNFRDANQGEMQIWNLSYSSVSLANWVVTYKHTLADDVACAVINHRNIRHFIAAAAQLFRILFKKKGLGNAFAFLWATVPCFSLIDQVKRLSKCFYNRLHGVIICKCTFFLKIKIPKP